MPPQISSPMGISGGELGMEMDPIALAWRGHMHNAPISTSPTITTTSASASASASPCSGSGLGLGSPHSALTIDTNMGMNTSMGVGIDCRDDECMRRHMNLPAVHKHVDSPLPPSLSALQSYSLTSSPSRSGDADTDTDAHLDADTDAESETEIGLSMARSIHSQSYSNSNSFSASFSASFSPSGPGLGSGAGVVDSRKSVTFSPEMRDDVESHSQSQVNVDEEVEVEYISEEGSAHDQNPFDYSFRDYLSSLFCMDSLCGSIGSTISAKSTSKSTEPPSKSLAERLSSCYTHGIFTYLPDPKYKKRRTSHYSTSATSTTASIDQFRGEFISQEEKQYALRWKGHLPLVPMHDSRAMEGRRRRRDTWRRARGVLIQRPGTGTGTGTGTTMSTCMDRMQNVDVHAVSDELELERGGGSGSGSGSGLKTLISGEGLTVDLFTESDYDSRSHSGSGSGSGSGDGDGFTFLCASP